jgi:predicted transcriptional regulator
MQLQLSHERQAQLDEYAQRHGQDPSTALDEVLAAALEWDRNDFYEAVEGIQNGYESVKAGRTRPASEFLNELRAKHGF